MMADPDRKFEYNGRLVFNGLYRLDLRETEISREDVFSTFPEYQRGTPADPGKGFSHIQFDEYEEYTELDPELSYSVDNIIYIKYKKEKFTEEELVNSEGEIETVFARDLNTVDIFLILPDCILFRGAKAEVQEAMAEVSTILNSTANLEHIDFHSDFLLWLFYIHEENEYLSSEIGIERLTDAKVSGERDVFGSTRRISGSTDILKSPPVITAILQNETLETIGGYFVYRDANYLSADISNSGRIHIKSRADIKQSGQLHRITLSISFIKEILDTYYEWQQLEPENRYPPIDFFERLYEQLREEGVSLEVPLDEVIEVYTKKREEQ
jgi:hypothetical protein